MRRGSGLPQGWGKWQGEAVQFEILLIKTGPVRGPHVFDLQIVPRTLARGATKLFTCNGADFRRFTDLELFEPAHESLLP